MEKVVRSVWCLLGSKVNGEGGEVCVVSARDSYHWF